MPKIKVYEYERCTTCKRAIDYLTKKKIQFERIPIKETPPKKAELLKMLKHLNGNIKKLFNTSGQLYRELNLSKKIATLSQDEALNLLMNNGMLVKRPFLLTDDDGTVGFKEPEWKKLLNS